MTGATLKCKQLSCDADDENKSVLKLHANHHHNGRVDVNFTMKVTGMHTNSLDRQVTERVNIENFKGGVLMNRRNEMGGVRLERMQYRRWGGESVGEGVGVKVDWVEAAVAIQALRMMRMMMKADEGRGHC